VIGAGNPAPELVASSFVGEPTNLEALRGHVVALHAFQLLCPGCRLHLMWVRTGQTENVLAAWLAMFLGEREVAEGFYAAARELDPQSQLPAFMPRPL